MFKCKECQEKFQSQYALNGHLKIHKKGYKKSNPGLYSIQKKQERLYEYNKNPRLCLKCKKSINYKKKLNKFCSHSCAISYNNSKRIRSKETKRKISESLKRYKQSKKAQQKIKNTKIIKEKINQNQIIRMKSTRLFSNFCLNCQKIFHKTSCHKFKYCSKNCQNNASSKSMIKKVTKKGTNNIGIKVKLKYKQYELECDSKLEAAGLIYIVNSYNPTKLERCKSILNYKNEENQIRRFNPDFYAIINNEQYLIEIKQKWKNTFHTNFYRSSIPFKKKALKEFCQNKNMKYLWLTPDIYDLNKIYKNINQYNIKKTG